MPTHCPPHLSLPTACPRPAPSNQLTMPTRPLIDAHPLPLRALNAGQPYMHFPFFLFPFSYPRRQASPAGKPNACRATVNFQLNFQIGRSRRPHTSQFSNLATCHCRPTPRSFLKSDFSRACGSQPQNPPPPQQTVLFCHLPPPPNLTPPRRSQHKATIPS